MENSINFLKKRPIMLTTIDNPYNPFEDFNNWLVYDNNKGYCSLDYLGRIANVSEEMSEEEIDEAINEAIDEIIRYDFMNVYTIVTDPNNKEE